MLIGPLSFLKNSLTLINSASTAISDHNLYFYSCRINTGMRVLTTILFVFVFAAYGNCRETHNMVYPTAIHKLFLTTGHSDALNAILMDEEWLDTREGNDFEHFENVAVLPEIHSDSPDVEVGGVAHYNSVLPLNLFTVLLLDLPPPSISI